MMKKIIDVLRNAFPNFILETKTFGKKEISIIVEANKLQEIALFLKKELCFDVLISAGAIDYIKQEIFQVVYYLWSSSSKVLLMLRTNIPRKKPSISSLVHIWEAGDYHEREIWEMFGINFQGHPNLTRLLLPEDWDGGFPLRKDFNLEECK